jgi:hypothetical protein
MDCGGQKERKFVKLDEASRGELHISLIRWGRLMQKS